MTKYYIGYKQANDEYVYVSNVNNYTVGLALNTNDAIDFINEEIAKNVCDYLNTRDNTKTYLPLIVTVNIEEVIENDIITNE